MFSKQQEERKRGAHSGGNGCTLLLLLCIAYLSDSLFLTILPDIETSGCRILLTFIVHAAIAYVFTWFARP